MATAVFASFFTGTILSTLRGLTPDLHLKIVRHVAYLVEQCNRFPNGCCIQFRCYLSSGILFLSLGELTLLQTFGTDVLQGGRRIVLQFGLRQKQLVFYDKIKETTNRKDYVPPEYQNKNLLRYELRLKNHIKQIFKVNKVTVPMLYDVQFYNRIVDYWKSEYRKIVKQNEYEIDITDCKGIRDLNKIGILLLVEQQGGMNEFFKNWTNNTIQGDWINDNVRKSNVKPRN